MWGSAHGCSQQYARPVCVVTWIMHGPAASPRPLLPPPSRRRRETGLRGAAQSLCACSDPLAYHVTILPPSRCSPPISLAGVRPPWCGFPARCSPTPNGRQGSFYTRGWATRHQPSAHACSNMSHEYILPRTRIFPWFSLTPPAMEAPRILPSKYRSTCPRSLRELRCADSNRASLFFPNVSLQSPVLHQRPPPTAGRLGHPRGHPLTFPPSLPPFSSGQFSTPCGPPAGLARRSYRPGDRWVPANDVPSVLSTTHARFELVSAMFLSSRGRPADPPIVLGAARGSDQSGNSKNCSFS